MLPGRAVVAAGAVGGGAAPDALVAARAVAMLLRGRMVASRAVARRAAVFAMLLIVAMLVFASRAVVTAAPIACASAVSAFRAHDAFLSTAVVYHNSNWCDEENMATWRKWARQATTPLSYQPDPKRFHSTTTASTRKPSYFDSYCNSIIFTYLHKIRAVPEGTAQPSPQPTCQTKTLTTTS